MRADDLSVHDLLRLHPAGGLISFAGQRTLLLDAVAMGILHEQLVRGLGSSAAGAMLGQVGYSYGWWLAEAMEKAFDWDSPEEWVRAGCRMSVLGGLFNACASTSDSLSEEGCTLHSSFEAEQHMLCFGRAHEPSCWTLCGLQSGYLSRAVGEAIFVTEDRCVARGDAACHFIGRNRAAWPARRAAELFCYTRGRQDNCLDPTLQQIHSTLRSTERTLRQRRFALTRLAPEVGSPGRTIANSAAMSTLLEGARQLAQGEDPVLLTGEEGVGKQRIARRIHELSRREAGPFVTGRCGDLPEALLESELFGHARGAFDDAAEDRIGLFEGASHGTLLLEEVADAPTEIQTKILRVLDRGEICRVGERHSRPVDVRLIATTSRSPPARPAQGGRGQGGRQPELLRRLHALELYVPALRERREDILPLARLMLAEAALSTRRRLPGFAPAVVECLLGYSWPGNVRELEEVMHKTAAICSGDRVELGNLPVELRPALGATTPTSSSVRLLDEVEREYILAALDRNQGNQARTAQQLEIGTATLYRKLRRYRKEGARTPQPPRGPPPH